MTQPADAHPDMPADAHPDMPPPDMPPPDMPPDWPHRAASRVIACAPHRWHVQVMGAGPDILLLHGAGGTTHSFRGLLPRLAADRRVIAPDLPGHGFTRGPRGRSGLDAMAADLARLIAQEGWRPQGLVGHSAGGAIALRLAQILPDPPRVIGINAALGAFEGVAGWLFPAVARVLAVTPLVPTLFARLSSTDRRVRELLRSTGSPLDDEGVDLYRRLVARPDHVAGALSMMADWRLDGLRASLPSIRVPVLLITSDRDTAVPPATSAEAAARLGCARLLDLPGYGHLVHEEAPETVERAIRGFLGDAT